MVKMKSLFALRSSCQSLSLLKILLRLTSNSQQCFLTLREYEFDCTRSRPRTKEKDTK